MSEQTSGNPTGACGEGPGIESSIRSDSSKYNSGTKQKQLIHEELNSQMNWQILVDRIKKGTARDIADEPKANNTPAIVIGSGPSLDDSIQFLKDWKGGIFCTTSHALTLMHYGIEPTHIIALDPFCTFDEIEGVDWSKTKTKLVAHPGVWPTLIEQWPNEILLYLENMGQPNSFYATTQKHQYSWRKDVGRGMREPEFNFYIRTEVILFACSPPIQMFMAGVLGYGNIFLAGVDFACTPEKDRFTDWKVKEYDPDTFELGTTQWEERKHPFVKSERTVYTNNGLPTEEIHLYYKKNMLSAWRLSNQTMYTTDHGSITEVPFVSMEKVVRLQGVMPKQPKKFIAKVSEKYLATVGAFVVESVHGITFVEAAKPELDLLNFMKMLAGQYKCPVCGIMLKNEDYINDHTGDECPQCKNKSLQRANPIDIEYNIKKFIHLLNMSGYETDRSKWVHPYNASTTMRVAN